MEEEENHHHHHHHHHDDTKSKGGKKNRLDRCALRILSCLLLLLGMILPALFTAILRPGTISRPRLNILPMVDPRETNELDWEGSGHFYLMQGHLREGASSPGCMWAGSGWVTGLVLTPDRSSLVVANWHARSLTVKSSFWEKVIPVPVQPLGLTLLEGGFSGTRVAVTSASREILVVDIDMPELPPENITTRKSYSSVTSGLSDDTLIVSTQADGQGRVSIDVITLQGDVIETLMDTEKCPDLRFTHFLLKEREDVLVSGLDRKNESTLIRLYHNSSGQWEAEKIQNRHLAGHLWGTAWHGRWGTFIGQDEGVVLRTPEGRFLPLMTRTDPHFNPTLLAVSGDRLVVVWDHAQVGDFVLVEYHLQALTPRNLPPSIWLK